MVGLIDDAVAQTGGVYGVVAFYDVSKLFHCLARDAHTSREVDNPQVEGPTRVVLFDRLQLLLVSRDYTRWCCRYSQMTGAHLPALGREWFG